MFLNRLCQSVLFSVVLFAVAFAQTELVKNGNFSSGSTNWTLNKYGGSSSGSVVNGEYAIIVTTAGTEHWHVQFIQTGISLVQGKSYTYSFDAYKGNQNSGTQSMQVNIGQSGSPYTSYFGSQNNLVTLTTTKTRYTYQIAMTQPSDANARLEFNCGKSTGGFYIDNVSLIESSNPLLSATPLSIDFGTIVAGTPKTVNVSLQNNGGAATTVSNLTSSSGNFIPGLTAPIAVPAAGTVTLPVTFSTGSAGAYSGSLTILSNATNNPTITVTLSGSAEYPGIGISPATLSFSTTPNTPSSKTITLSNTGSTPILEHLKREFMDFSGSGFGHDPCWREHDLCRDGKRRLLRNLYRKSHADSFCCEPAISIYHSGHPYGGFRVSADMPAHRTTGPGNRFHTRSRRVPDETA
jgi:hypothetical protein